MGHLISEEDETKYAVGEGRIQRKVVMFPRRQDSPRQQGEGSAFGVQGVSEFMTTCGLHDQHEPNA